MDESRIEQILDWIVHNFVQILLILSLFIQITPIKWNPLSSLVKWLGKLLNADTNKQIGELQTQVSDMRDDLDENEKDRIRWEILDFANSCRNGRKHSKDEFQHIITLHDKYKLLLERTGDKNGVFDAEYNWIDQLYKERQQKNDFLET